jgi:acyl carrier protein phosphodiesterase
MNYLAHAYLSFGHPDILAGNMISDYVKGKTKYSYSKGVQEGISLHREIDRFTDVHLTIKSIKEIFRPAYRLYSGAIIDVLFDHFLAIDENEFKKDRLNDFAQKTYNSLNRYYDIFPEKFKVLFPYMKNQNWLYNYSFRHGIEKSLGGLVRRSKYMEESETAYRLFDENYILIENAYKDFFPDVKNLSINFINSLNETNQ